MSLEPNRSLTLLRAGLPLAVVLVLATGCRPRTETAFGHQFLDNRQADLGAALARLPAASRDDHPRNALGEPIVVATTYAEDGAERRLIALALHASSDGSREPLWSVAIDAATQPEILGDVVLTSTRERLIALDLRTGRELWHEDLPDLAYVGAAREGATIFWVATVGALGGARRVGQIVAADARSGGSRWRHEVVGVLGQPAASGGLVFVPWERQNIALLDQTTGHEVARLRSTDDVLAWAFDHPTGVYYGGRGIYRLTARSVTGARDQSTYLRPALGELPRQPESIWPDGYLPKPGARSARGRIRVYFEPAPARDDATVAIEGDTYYFAYYRYVFAYDAAGSLRWARIFEQDVIGAQPTPRGLLTVGELGAMRLLDQATGQDVWTQDDERPLASVAIDAAGFNPASHPGQALEAAPLRQTLNELVLDPDNRLVAARAYAVQLLAQLPEEEVTRDLLDLYQQRAMPGALKESLREALRTRQSGAQYLLAALARRYDYLEDTQAPPLEAIVPALLQMHVREAVPALIQHMFDHETPADVLPIVVDGVVQLGGADAIPALHDFLVRYHADGEFQGPVAEESEASAPDAPETNNATVAANPPAAETAARERPDPEARALAIAANGVFQHGGPEGRELLSSLAGESARTLEPVADYIRGLYRAEREAQERAAREEQERARAALEAARREAEDALPARLSQQQINQTFATHADPIRECIAGELERNPSLAQVRVAFLLSNRGRASQVTVSPNRDELRACLTPEVERIEFSRFRHPRMSASFVVSIRGTQSAEGVEETGLPPLPNDAPWWAWEERRALEQAASGPTPASPTAVAAWWMPRDAPVVATVGPVAPVTDEAELPPGMAQRTVESDRTSTARSASSVRSAEPPSTQARSAQARGRTSGVPPSMSSTAATRATNVAAPANTAPAEEVPWWAGASSTDAPEEASPEDAPAPDR